MRSYPLVRLSIAAIAIISLASCHKKNDQGRMVPKDALFVMTANQKDLSAKLPLEDIYKDSFFESAMADDKLPASVKMLCMHPDSAGVDMSSDIIFFASKDSNGTYITVEGSIKDANLFKAFNQKILPDGVDTTSNDISYINHYPVCAGWNKDKFVYVYDMAMLNHTNPYSDPALNAGNNRDVYATCKSLFELPETSSLAVNEKFSKLVKAKSDLHLWINSGSIYGSGGASMSLLNLSDLYSDNVSAINLSFDDGKITMDCKSYVNDKLMALYKKYLGDKINEDMIQRLPGKEVAAILAWNFKPAGMQEFLKLINVDGLVNTGLSRWNLSLNDIAKAFKGNAVIAATDIHEKLDTIPLGATDGSVYTKKDLAGNYIFAADIDDLPSFNKIFGVLTKSSNEGDFGPDVNFESNNSFFVATNSKDASAKYLAGGGNHYDFVSDISGEPFGGYINIHPILALLQDESDKDSLTAAIYTASVAMWKDFSFKGGNINDDAIESSMTIDLMDKNTNSLKQLHGYFSKVEGLRKQKRAADEALESEDVPVVDSTAAIANP